MPWVNFGKIQLFLGNQQNNEKPKNNNGRKSNRIARQSPKDYRGWFIWMNFKDIKKK